MKMVAAQSLSCPSYVAKPGVELFGIMDDGGEVRFLQETIVVDHVFIDEASKGGRPEERFRFTGKCIERGCKQWDDTSKACTLARKLIDAFGNTPEKELIPFCPIRKRCRWFAQEGELACANCTPVFRNHEARALDSVNA
jgi:hypothetical protein